MGGAGKARRPPTPMPARTLTGRRMRPPLPIQTLTEILYEEGNDMGYGIPASMKGAVVSAWPGGIGGIPATLANGTPVKIPVLQGVNVLTFGVVGTGKTRSYTLPAAECLLRANPRMLGVFFEIKRSFIDHFL